MAETNYDTHCDDVVDDRSLWQKVKDGCNKAKLWAGEHKGELIMGGITIVGGIIGLADSYGKQQKRREQHEKIYRTVYDRSKGNYIISKKDIKPEQQREINRRRENGEDIYDICDDLGIKLKR